MLLLWLFLFFLAHCYYKCHILDRMESVCVGVEKYVSQVTKVHSVNFGQLKLQHCKENQNKKTAFKNYEQNGLAFKKNLA